jgi:hypothetical protein
MRAEIWGNALVTHFLHSFNNVDVKRARLRLAWKGSDPKSTFQSQSRISPTGLAGNHKAAVLSNLEPQGPILELPKRRSS